MARGFKDGGDNLVKKLPVPEIKDDQKFYHVTSVLGYINPPSHTVPEDDLIQYAARGSLAHLEIAFILGKAMDLREKRKFVKILEEGSKGFKPIELQVFKDFMLKYPNYLWETPIEVEYEMYDDGLSLCGTLDLVVKHNGKLALCDWKTASSYGKDKKAHYFKQLAAYSLMWQNKGLAPIEELCIFPLNPKNKYGYGEPIRTDEVEKWQDAFMKDYKKFISLTK